MKTVKKKQPKIIDLAIVAAFDDGKCRHVVAEAKEVNAILNLLVVMNGSIKVIDKEIEGITIERVK